MRCPLGPDDGMEAAPHGDGPVHDGRHADGQDRVGPGVETAGLEVEGPERQSAPVDAAQSEAFERHRAFLDELEDTPMTKSYKMLVLLAMLNEDAFPGEITIDALAEATRTLASRNHRLMGDSARPPPPRKA